MKNIRSVFILYLVSFLNTSHCYEFEVGVDFSRLIVGTVTGKDLINDDSLFLGVYFSEKHIIGYSISSLYKDNNGAFEDGFEDEMFYRYHFSDDLNSFNFFSSLSVGKLSYNLKNFKTSDFSNKYTNGEVSGRSYGATLGLNYRLNERIGLSLALGCKYYDINYDREIMNISNKEIITLDLERKGLQPEALLQFSFRF